MVFNPSCLQKVLILIESAPALLAGLSVLLNTLTLLSEYMPEELARLVVTVLSPFEDVWIPVSSRLGAV